MSWKLNFRLPIVNSAPTNDSTTVSATATYTATAAEESESKNVTLHVPQARIEAATLHACYLNDVFAYVARRVRGREEAEDITAEVFAAAFEALPRFRGQCHPRLWLLGIARRKIVDSLRRRKTRRETLASELEVQTGDADSTFKAVSADEPATAYERGETLLAVRTLVQTLKEEQREVLLLKYVEGLSINEIAVVMKRSPAAVNSLLQHARASVFREGQAYFGDDEVTP